MYEVFMKCVAYVSYTNILFYPLLCSLLKMVNYV